MRGAHSGGGAPRPVRRTALRRALPAAGLLGLWRPLARSARAQEEAESTLSAALLPGSLSVTAGAVSLGQSSGPEVDFALETTIVDARGNGAGWRLAVTATVDDTSPGPPAAALDPVATVTHVEQFLLSGRAAMPTGAVSYPVPLSSGVLTTVFDAAALSGMGTIMAVLRGSIHRRVLSQFGTPAFTVSVAGEG